MALSQQAFLRVRWPRRHGIPGDLTRVWITRGGSELCLRCASALARDRGPEALERQRPCGSRRQTCDLCHRRIKPHSVVEEGRRAVRGRGRAMSLRRVRASDGSVRLVRGRVDDGGS